MKTILAVLLLAIVAPAMSQGVRVNAYGGMYLTIMLIRIMIPQIIMKAK